MEQINHLITNPNTKTKLAHFLIHYGEQALNDALQDYSNAHNYYIIKKRRSTQRILFHEICYIKVRGHSLHIRTHDRTYQQYGTLSKEYERLKSYGFAKCNQSSIISIPHIRGIEGHDVTMQDGTVFHLSRLCYSDVISAYRRYLNQ